MLHDLTYADALDKAEHLKALGQTDVYLYGRTAAADFPYGKVSRVEAGSSYRLSGPSSAMLFVVEDGISFRLSVDFEAADANGKGVSLFDRDRLRELMRRLPEAGRNAFSALLSNEVLPGLKKRTDEIRQALREQEDSEDCVRGLIAFAEREAA